MPLALMTGAAAGIWLFMLVFITSLGKMAARGDNHALDPRQAIAEELGLGEFGGAGTAGAPILSLVEEVDLEAHPRPTRAHPVTSVRPRTSPRGADSRLTADEAATTLGVSPDALQAWERQYGYPVSQGSASGRERSYRYTDVLALNEALQACVSIPSAINGARAHVRGAGSPGILFRPVG